MLLEPERLTDAALDPISVGRQGSMPARNQKSEPRKSTATVPKIEGITAGAAAQSAAQQDLEICATPESTRWAESVLMNRAPAPPPGRTDHAPMIPD